MSSSSAESSGEESRTQTGLLSSWSWQIARIAGIPIYVHWTFLILIGWLLFAGLSAGRSLPQTLGEVGFVLALFGCVVLHELGHAMMASRFGVETSDITLLPIGGVARLERIPEKPIEEFLVAIAGPAVNVLIAGLLWVVGARINIDMRDERMLMTGGTLGRLLVVNLFLVVFNLLPAFPMDGGRILRALLAMKLEYGRATRIASAIGQFMAIVFGFWALVNGNVMLLLIALFVWIGAQSEAGAVSERIGLRDVPVRAAMLTEFATLAPDDDLGRAADLLIAGSQHDFPVFENGTMEGVLTRAALIRGLSERGRNALVRDYQSKSIGSVDANSMLIAAVQALRGGAVPCLQVTDGGRAVGILTAENASEYLMIKSALSQAKASAG